MTRELRPAAGGVAAAIAVTTTMDATGYTAFSALPLFPLGLLFWYLQGFSRQEIGLVRGVSHDYAWAVAYPAAVLSGLAALAWVAGFTDTSDTDWKIVLINVGAGSTIGILVVVMTEEGFFRGWLWASLEKAGYSQTRVLALTTLAFVAWHISPITLDTGYDVPLAQIPIYLINATLLGLIWGLLRLTSGSVLVPAVCHAVWNAFAYAMYGFGEHVGALGIEKTYVFGPEVGLLGIIANSAFAFLLWRRYAQ